MAEKKAYRLAVGRHRERGVAYVRGDIVESEFELDKIHKNKFVPLDGSVRTIDPTERSAKDDPAALKGRRDDDDPITLKKIHKGGGKYIVVNEETGEQVNDGLLNKEEANALIQTEE